MNKKTPFLKGVFLFIIDVKYYFRITILRVIEPPSFETFNI